MKKLFLIFLFLISSFAFSKNRVIISAIYDFDIEKNGQDFDFIRLESGDVVFFSNDIQDIKNDLVLFMNSKSMMTFHVDEFHNLLYYEIHRSSRSSHSINPSRMLESNLDDSRFYEKNFSYAPTLLSGLSDAQQIFRKMRRDYQYFSQCYNRAHVWSYEEYSRSFLKSMKYFLFFTRSYIRSYRFKWWFHVSPAVKIKNIGDYVLDRRFMSYPVTVDQWTNHFVYSRRRCPRVSYYNEYRNHQESEHCYLISVSMFFWQPRDIVYRDQTGFVKTYFVRSEMSHSYWEAF